MEGTQCEREEVGELCSAIDCAFNIWTVTPYLPTSGLFAEIALLNLFYLTGNER